MPPWPFWKRGSDFDPAIPPITSARTWSALSSTFAAARAELLARPEAILPTLPTRRGYLAQLSLTRPAPSLT